MLTGVLFRLGDLVRDIHHRVISLHLRLIFETLRRSGPISMRCSLQLWFDNRIVTAGPNIWVITLLYIFQIVWLSCLPLATKRIRFIGISHLGVQACLVERGHGHWLIFRGSHSDRGYRRNRSRPIVRELWWGVLSDLTFLGKVDSWHCKFS